MVLFYFGHERNVGRTVVQQASEVFWRRARVWPATLRERVITVTISEKIDRLVELVSADGFHPGVETAQAAARGAAAGRPVARAETEANMTKLTPKHARFVEEYLIDLNATQTSIRAGYSKKSANTNAVRLMANEGIRHALVEATARCTAKAELVAVEVLEELRRVVFFDTGCLFDAYGNLRPLVELTVEERSAIAGIEVISKNPAAGDGTTDTIYKVQVAEKLKAIELAMKYLQLLVEQVEAKATVDVVQILRARYAKRRPQ